MMKHDSSLMSESKKNNQISVSDADREIPTPGWTENAENSNPRING